MANFCYSVILRLQKSQCYNSVRPPPIKSYSVYHWQSQDKSLVQLTWSDKSISPATYWPKKQKTHHLSNTLAFLWVVQGAVLPYECSSLLSESHGVLSGRVPRWFCFTISGWTVSLFDDYLNYFQLVLQRLKQHGVKIKSTKCQLFKKEISYLGKVI